MTSELRKSGSEKCLQSDDSVTIQIHRSTNIAAVPTNVETIASQTTKATTATTTTTTTTTETTATTTTTAVKPNESDKQVILSKRNSSSTIQISNFNNLKSIVLNIVNQDDDWEYAQIEFDANNYVKFGSNYHSNPELIEESSEKTSITSSISGDKSKLTITFNENYHPNSFTITNMADASITVGYDLNYASSGNLPHRPTRPVELDIVSNSTEAPLAQATPSLVSNKILSRMVGARSGEVERMMELRTQENTLLTLNDTINLFYATSGITIIPVFNEPVVVTPDDGWEKEIRNLPAYDLNGKPYYYWAEETAGSAGYAVSYQFDDGNPSTIYCIDSSSLGNGLITVQNKKEETPEGADLPTSGGSGTAPYRTAGFLLMLTAVTFPYIKHRNRRKRNSA